MAFFDTLRRAVGMKPGDATRRAALAAAVDEVEAELKRMGWWQDTPPEPERMQFRQPFGMDTLAFSQWLQFVFVPAARSMIAGERPLPPSSMLAPHAVREYDGQEEETWQLCNILRRVDAAVNGRD